MTREENIRAILETNFAGMKDEIIDNAVNRIMELEQEPTTKNDLGVEKVEVRKPCINYEDGCEEWAGCPCVHFKARK